MIARTPLFPSERIPRSFQLAQALLWVLAAWGCGSGATTDRNESVTVRFIGSGPLTMSELRISQESFSKFTSKTGIQVLFLPGPESSTQRLKTYEQGFQQKSSTPDVYLLDIVWPGILAEHLTDLRPYLGEEEVKERFPAELQNDTVGGKLVAMPASIERGALYYRTDLLKKYRFAHPPETWEELEKMASRIEAGERSAGNADFWGFVWQGAAYEGLTCNALEWQASEGGGRIVEDDKAISVNNPSTVAALERARHWVGSISPPSVINYKEEDSRNIFLAGNAAFRRDWVWTTNPTKVAESSPVFGKVGVTLLPRGAAGHSSVMGGWSLAVSKYSAHPREAAELVRYMTSREGRTEIIKDSTLLPARSDFYADPKLLELQPDLGALKETLTTGGTARPSTITGKEYGDVSRAYFSAVHSILAGETSAAKAMADLERELIKATGFGVKEPRAGNAQDAPK